MRTLAIGDIHGGLKALKEILEKAQVTTKDKLVFLGDYVDKGITSRQVVEYVQKLQETFPEHVVALLGNHELELLRDRSPDKSTWGGYNYYQLSYCT